jgi:hypothetical protein
MSQASRSLVLSVIVRREGKRIGRLWVRIAVSSVFFGYYFTTITTTITASFYFLSSSASSS